MAAFLPFAGAAIGTALAPSLGRLFGGSPKPLVDTYAYRDAFRQARDPGWQAAADINFDPNASNYQYNPQIGNQLQGIGNSLANFNYNPQQVGGGQTAADLASARGNFADLTNTAQQYANSPLVSALAQRQGINQGLAAQRTASLSGPLQFNQGLAARNAALAGGNITAQAIQQGAQAQAQEKLDRQKYLADAQRAAGVGQSGLADIGLKGQAYNQAAGLDAAKLGLLGQSSAADILGNLGTNQLKGSMALEAARQQQSQFHQQGLLDMFGDKANLAQSRLGAAAGVAPAQYQAHQQAIGAGFQAAGGLGYGLGNALQGLNWNNQSPQLQGNFGNQLGSIFGSGGAGGALSPGQLQGPSQDLYSSIFN